jgi:LPS sulfotransferase NodH
MACTLLMATTPRSGSWLLGDFLTQTGVIGTTREYFHVNYVAALSRQLGLSSETITPQYIETVLGRFTGPGGVFSTKLHWLQVNQLVSALRRIHPELASGPAPQLIEASMPEPRYLYLGRRDKSRQALSMYRAMCSDQWWDSEPSPGTPPAPRRTQRLPAADYLAVRWFEDHLRAEEEEWRRYFEVFGISPFHLTYEDLVTEPASVMRAILDWIGFTDLAVPALTTSLRKQADAESERAVSEYLTVRHLLPSRPDGWLWHEARKAFGPPERPHGATAPIVAPPAVSDLSPL